MSVDWISKRSLVTRIAQKSLSRQAHKCFSSAQAGARGVDNSCAAAFRLISQGRGTGEQFLGCSLQAIYSQLEAKAVGAQSVPGWAQIKQFVGFLRGVRVLYPANGVCFIEDHECFIKDLECFIEVVCFIKDRKWVVWAARKC